MQAAALFARYLPEAEEREITAELVHADDAFTVHRAKAPTLEGRGEPLYLLVCTCAQPTREALNTYHAIMEEIYAAETVFRMIVDCRSIVSAPLPILWAHAKFMKRAEDRTRMWMRCMDIHLTPAAAAILRVLFSLRAPQCPVALFV
jgi:hypothetical protein